MSLEENVIEGMKTQQDVDYFDRQIIKAYDSGYKKGVEDLAKTYRLFSTADFETLENIFAALKCGHLI